MPGTCARFAALTLLLACGAARAEAGGSLVRIEDAAGVVGPQATALAGDGSRLAGTDLFQQGWEYTQPAGLAPLPTVPGGGPLRVWDLSADGGFAVGTGETAGGSQEAMRYSAAGGVELLGTLPGDTSSRAFAVSADGSVVVGTSGIDAFLWTPASGMQTRAGAIGSVSAATGMSADGSVVSGAVSGIEPASAFRWTAGTGMVPLGALPDHESSGDAVVSADGATIAGSSNDDDTNTTDAFRWTASGGMVSLGRCSGTASARPSDISGDGAVIVGDCWSEDAMGQPVRTAFIWTQAGGLRPFQTFLAENGIDGSALSIPVVTGVSDDGRTFTGYDEDPNDTAAFVAVLGAPAAVPIPAGATRLLVLGLLGAAWISRRRT
jgi:uncharacterized membrane protein